MSSRYSPAADATAVDPQTWSDIYNLSTQSQTQDQTSTQPRMPLTYDQTAAMSTWNSSSNAPFVQQPQASRQSYPSEPSLQSAPAQTQTPDDSVLGFIRSMPTKGEDSSRHALWTELVRLKTRALELQIADAKAKEKEAEAELFKLKMMYRDKGGDVDMTLPVQSGQQDVFGGLPMSNKGSGEYMQRQQVQSQGFYGQPGGNALDLGMSGNFGSTAMPSAQGSADQVDQLPTSMTTFDLEAMMQHNNLDNMFSWLPDFGDTSRSTFPVTAQPQGVDPSALFNTQATEPQFQYHEQTLATPKSVKPNITSPLNRRSRTPDEDEPANKKIKRPEKKTVVEHTSECTICAKPLARIMLRAPKTSIPDLISIEYACPECRPVNQPPPLSDMYGSGSSGIGTVDSRKRLRVAMEAVDDDKAEIEARRAFCDVCQRVFGSGMTFGGPIRENLGSMLEVVCTGCDSKYSRCTDCGGGGGGRVGIGKWRMKQVFQPGRKTCSLSHTRLGDRPREIGVHVTPTDFTAEELKEVLARCKQLWNEKTLARLAVPEMLEIDLPAHLTNPIRNYADVEDIVTQNWPNRESMIRAEGADPKRFKRLLGLVWAHSKSRRGTRTVDIEEEWQKSGDGDADDMSTVLDNVKRTNLAIPGGSELIGMWGGEWDMKHGSLLVSTFIPFEGTDGEDSTALSVGEMITKVQMMRQSMNQERKEAALANGVDADLVRQCEHLWVVSGGAMPLVRERIADILIRKRSFVHVDEYLTRHPDFANALSARPVGLHPDVLRSSPSSPETKPPPLVLDRWLGKDFDAGKILEIKQAEFGGKANKLKKKAKVK